MTFVELRNLNENQKKEKKKKDDALENMAPFCLPLGSVPRMAQLTDSTGGNGDAAAAAGAGLSRVYVCMCILKHAQCHSSSVQRTCDVGITMQKPRGAFGFMRWDDGWLLRTTSLCAVLMMLSEH